MLYEHIGHRAQGRLVRTSLDNITDTERSVEKDDIVLCDQRVTTLIFRPPHEDVVYLRFTSMKEVLEDVCRHDLVSDDEYVVDWVMGAEVVVGSQDGADQGAV